MLKKLFTILLFTCILNLYMIKNTYASESTKEVSKPLVILQGETYNDYLNYKGYTILENNLNTDKCGDYQIVYQKTLTNEQITKRIFVKSSEELLSQKCYNEQYQNLYNSKQRMLVHQAKYYQGYYYFGIAEETTNGLYNLSLIKTDLENLIFKKELMTYTNGQIVDFVFETNEIVLLINYATDKSQDVMLKFITLEGNNLCDTIIKGNDYDKGIKIFKDDGYYYIPVESSSTDELFKQTSTTKGLYMFKIMKSNRQIVSVRSNIANYDLKVIDVVETNEGYVCLTSKYDPNIKMRILELNLYSKDEENFTLKKEFLRSTLIDALAFRTNDRDEMFIMTENNKKFDLYSVFADFSSHLLNTYYYQKAPNAVFADFIINDYNNIEILYNVIDNKKAEPYGYIYQLIENDNIALEIENYSPTMMAKKFINEGEILFADNNQITIDKIKYLIVKSLNNQITLNNEDLSTYPLVYIDAKQIYLNEEKSKLDYDLNQYGTYPIKFYFSTKNVDIIIPGSIEVLPQINIKNNETYDLKLQLKFNGKGVLNNLNITNEYIIEQPGTYKLEVYGKDDICYNVNFVVTPITDNNEYKKNPKNELSVKNEILTSDKSITINNNIKENEISNDKNQYLWTLLIPIAISILLIMGLIKKRR